MQLWKLASPKSAQKASRLEIQGRANVTIQAWRPPAAEFPFCLEQVRLLSTQVFNWLDETHSHCGGQPVYSKSTDLYINLI